MTMGDKDKTHDPLEVFFGAARAATPEPSPALLARVLADADAAMQRHRQTGPHAAVARVPRRGGLAALLAVLGGWRTVGGLVTATLAGLWIGFAGSDRLSDVAAGYLGGGAVEVLGTVDLLPGDDVFALAMGTEG